MVPNLREPIAGCAFAPRCAFARERCRVEPPPIRAVGPAHTAACWEAERVMAA
jgi:peptide/nickel transport system ATP-binding protein